MSLSLQKREKLDNFAVDNLRQLRSNIGWKDFDNAEHLFVLVNHLLLYFKSEKRLDFVN